MSIEDQVAEIQRKLLQKADHVVEGQLEELQECAEKIDASLERTRQGILLLASRMGEEVEAEIRMLLGE